MNIKEKFPKYLYGKLKNVQIEKVNFFFENKDWFNSLDWKGQLVIEKIDDFRIFHTGIYDLTDGAIYTENDEPLIIIGKYSNNEKQCIIFDERIHGFNYYVNNIEQLGEIVLKEYSYKNYKNEYEVYVYGNSSIDFEDEFPKNDQGLIKINEFFYELEYLKYNAFDFIGILLVNKKVEIKILEVELV